MYNVELSATLYCVQRGAIHIYIYIYIFFNPGLSVLHDNKSFPSQHVKSLENNPLTHEITITKPLNIYIRDKTI